MADASNLSDALALANALAAGREKDKEFKDVLGDVSTALTEIVGLMEESPKENAKIMAEAFSKALAESLAAALRSAFAAMPTPQVHAPVTVAGPKDWTTMKAVPEYDMNGRVKCFNCTRS